VNGSELETMIREWIVIKVIDSFGERRENGPDTKVSFSDSAAD